RQQGLRKRLRDPPRPYEPRATTSGYRSLGEDARRLSRTAPGIAGAGEVASMSKTRLSRRHLIAALALATPISACSTSPPPRRFVLAPRPANKPLPATGRVMIANVGVAKYLDQPQIVRHSSEYELTLADLERWGEGLADTVARVLAEDLAA